MTSLSEQAARLAALELLVQQLMIQHFRNVAGPVWKQGLADWKRVAVGVLSDQGNAAAAAEVQAIYDKLVPEIEHARSRN